MLGCVKKQQHLSGLIAPVSEILENFYEGKSYGMVATEYFPKQPTGDNCTKRWFDRKNA